MRKIVLGTLASGLFATGLATAQTPAVVKIGTVLPPDEPQAIVPPPKLTPKPLPAFPAPAAVPATPTAPALDFPPPVDPPLSIQTMANSNAGNSPVIALPAVRSLELASPESAAAQKPATPPVPPATSPAAPAAVAPSASTPAPATASAACPPQQSFATSTGSQRGFSPNNPWVSAEYLLFAIRKDPTPPLVQAVSVDAANIAIQTGQLPPNSTINLFDQPEQGAFSGIRGQVGVWLDEQRNWGIEADYFQLFRKSDQYSIDSPGVPVIGRDFFDIAAGLPAFLRYTNPNGSQRGYIRIDAPSQAIGGELNVRYHGLTVFSDRTDYIGGVRYLNLREAVGIDSGSFFINQANQIDTVYTSSELFRTRNQFWGPQVGFESHFARCGWSLDIGAKIAIGGVRQDVSISGATAVNQAGVPQQFFPNQSLLFVQPTNAGAYSRDRFAAVPEFMVRFGYQIAPRIRATIGYDFIAMADVVRPGNTIDTTVNPNNTQFIARNQPSNAPRPGFSFNDSTWWAQGMTVGLVMNY